MIRPLCLAVVTVFVSDFAPAQEAPYDEAPEVAPPYYRVRYEAGSTSGGLIFPVQYTVWIPPGVDSLKGVVVHQHGCGEGSCRSGQTGVFDLHWQALAAAHDCALMAPSYEQPQDADCQQWCDPRNGSGIAFQKGLVDLGKLTGHPELPSIPWALWGHSGGGHWAGGMTLLHPDRVVAAWLRSGVPLLEINPDRPSIQAHILPEAALAVPIMCNPGTKEGVTVKEGRFARVWPANERFFDQVRSRGGLIGVAVDPLTAHECGNQRYLAIPWLSACLDARLPQKSGHPLRPMPLESAWLAGFLETTAYPVAEFEGKRRRSFWLPNREIAEAWEHYVRDTEIPDNTKPPRPTSVVLDGKTLRWEAEADPESGLGYFLIERDGVKVASIPDKLENRFGRPLFQGLQYSDTPSAPLVSMSFEITGGAPGATYRVIAVNTVGLASEPSEPTSH